YGRTQARRIFTNKKFQRSLIKESRDHSIKRSEKWKQLHDLEIIPLHRERCVMLPIWCVASMQTGRWIFYSIIQSTVQNRCINFCFQLLTIGPKKMKGSVLKTLS